MKINWSKIATYPAPLRLGIFIVILLICWLPIALPLYLILNYDPNLASIITMVALFGIFLFLLKFWSDRVYGISKGFQFYGLVWTRQNGIDWLKGIAIGLLLTFTLFFTESLFGWVQIQASKVFLLKIILEGSLTGLGVAFAEELFFRGWILTELEKDYSLNQSLWSNALIFATLHFLKPLGEIIRTFPQFPALVLLGIALVLAKRSHRQTLGICMGLHGGLVWGYYIFNVGELIKYSDTVPTWITGIDRNPLAGLMGIFFLSMLVLWSNQAQIKILHK